MMFFKLLRVDNWIKNSFIFLPLFFAAQFLETQKLIDTLIVTIGFSLTTSFVYIVNDIFDRNFDKNHPEKKNRPIASGRISPAKALIIGTVILLAGLVIIGRISMTSLTLTIIYLVLNMGYSLKLKQVPIIDFIFVSLGFVIRILIGSDVGDIPLTQWMIVMVFLLSLFIAITKRRDDVYQYEFEKKLNRRVVDKYTVEFMDKSITIVSSVLIVSYLMFITSAEVNQRYNSDYLFVTFLPVLVGILRYNQITYVYNKSGSPIKLLFKDLFLQITLLSWGLIFFLIIYYNQLPL